MISLNGVSQLYFATQLTKSNSDRESYSAAAETKQAGVKTGIPITEGMEIDLSQYELIKAPDFPENRLLELPTPMSTQEYRNQLTQQGDVRQTAVIKRGGEIVGTISDKGMMFLDNAMGKQIIEAGLSADSDVDSIQSFLRERYGNNIQVEQFSQGTGPTYAEIHDRIYAESYSSLVSRQTEEYRQNYDNSLPGRFVNITA